jgi:ABC-type amino acid transport substrate-binding protein
MKLHHILMLIIIALGAGYGGARLATTPSTTEAKKETAYERVMRTQTIRCGYFPYAPMLTRDPNTGAMTGIAADVMMAIGQRLGLTIEWTTEFGFASAVSDMQMGRFDVACIGFWRLPQQAKYLTYTSPFLFSQMRAYVRADDTRFDKSYESINQAGIRIISADGQMSATVAKTEFPNATLLMLSNMTPYTQQFEDVIAGKADVMLAEAAAAGLFIAANPGKIRATAMPHPLRTFQNTFAMNMGEESLRTLLDSALIDIIQNGELDRILARYDTNSTIFLKPAAGYTTP